jgi:protein SCO1/2
MRLVETSGQKMNQLNKYHRPVSSCFAAVLSVLLTGLAMASTDDSAQETDAVKDPHAGHKQMMQHEVRYVKSLVHYSMPDVDVLDQHGNRTPFQDLMASESPLVLNYIFTSCTTICPVLSATFSQAQDDLQEMSAPPIMISVSIDPDYDTPERLLDYANTFRAGPDWLFLTGTQSDMLDIQKSFDAYRGDKLNHIPLTFLRASPDSPWIRLEGFTSARQLVQEYEALISTPPE